jgi:hypothetical protein
MAKIVEDVVIIKFSKLAKDDATDASNIVGKDVQLALEQVAQELVGDSVIVEVMSGNL